MIPLAALTRSIWDSSAPSQAQAEVEELRGALEEAGQKLQGARVQLAEVSTERDSIRAQAETAARDTAQLLQQLAQRTGGFEGNSGVPFGSRAEAGEQRIADVAAADAAAQGEIAALQAQLKV